MKGWTGARRTGSIVVLMMLGLAACRDNGLPDRNLPLQEARHRTYGYPLYESAPDNTPVVMAGRAWSPSLPVETMPAQLLVPVGTAGSTALFAVRGTRAPYSRLYAQAGEGRWRPYLRLN